MSGDVKQRVRCFVNWADYWSVGSTSSRELLNKTRPVLAVVSTGRRNTLAKSLCWRLEVQCFPGPLVELARHLVQLGLGVRSEIKA
jgi:hypothetical protein